MKVFLFSYADSVITNSCPKTSLQKLNIWNLIPPLGTRLCLYFLFCQSHLWFFLFFRSQAKKSLASWLRRSKLWPFTADTCGSASLLYVSMTLLKRQKWEERHQPEMPQEGAEMLHFHKTQLLPTPSTKQRRRQCWIERRIVVLCADRQETLQGVKKKRKENPQRITAAVQGKYPQLYIIL